MHHHPARPLQTTQYRISIQQKGGFMNTMIRNEQRTGKLDQNYFGRSIEDIVSHNFFNSFDANVHCYSDHYLIEVAVPGFRKRDLSIHINDGILLVSASRAEKSSDPSEFSYSSFNRSFVLPSDVDESRVKARCRDGILRIKLLKITETKAGRTIPVTGGVSYQGWWNTVQNRLRQWLRL